MTTQDLINRLRDTASKGVSVWGDLQMEAAKEIETLLAERECYASAMDRMQAALAEPSEPKPYCCYCESDNEGIRSTYFDQTCEGCVKRMTHPAKPSPLTDEEIYAIWPYPEGTNSVQCLARAVEAVVWEKMK